MLPAEKYLPIAKKRLSTLFTPIRHVVLFSLCLWVSVYTVAAQDIRSCVTVEIDSIRKAHQLKPETRETFEKWMGSKIQDTRRKLARTTDTEAAIYTIPVVVHIIHNGEAVGIGTNISDTQVQSQIRILNEDYRRKSGTKGFSTNPVSADSEIEFKLALSDPDGFPTTGIVRSKGSKQSWDTEDETALKSISYWPSQNYLNIWVCNLDDDLLGYSQFPESDQIQGISAIGAEEASLDGLVIGYKYFGDVGAALASGNDFRYGRTTTHEVGHFLGLRHTWGDPPTASQGCSYDDYCEDTPNTTQPNYNCPASDSTTCTSPKTREMVENYMDYTDDACMNIFTQDQVLRMRTVLENSPRRVSLLSSPGLNPVILAANDARVTQILSPGSLLCDNTFSPVIVLRNYGSSVLTQVKLSYDVDAGNDFVYTWTGNLATAQRDTLTLSPIQVNPGNYTFQVVVSSANEAIISSDVAKAEFQVSTVQNLPFWANFDKALLENEWLILNEDNNITWRDTLVSTSTNTSNRAAYLNYYQYSTLDAQDALLTAPYDLSIATQAYLLFDVSYARRQSSEDGLGVLVSTDCGDNFNGENIVYQKTGSRLATVTTPTTQAWYPTQENQWREETINLSKYIGQKTVRFAFLGINDHGNNIYIDNVRVVFRTETLEEEVNGYKNLVQAFQIYPNPSQGKFNLRFNIYEPLTVQLNIYNTIGQQVYTRSIEQAKNNYEVDLSGLPAGMYLVNATSGKQKITKKILITH